MNSGLLPHPLRSCVTEQGFGSSRSALIQCLDMTRLPHVLLDTSAAVPFVVASHDAHKSTWRALHERRLGLAGHAWIETISVRRSPRSYRRPPPIAAHQSRPPSSRYRSGIQRSGRTSRVDRAPEVVGYGAPTGIF